MSESDRHSVPSASTSSRRRGDEPGEDDLLFEVVAAAIEVTEEEHEAVPVVVHVLEGDFVRGSRAPGLPMRRERVGEVLAFGDPDGDALTSTPWAKAR